MLHRTLMPAVGGGGVRRGRDRIRLDNTLLDKKTSSAYRHQTDQMFSKIDVIKLHMTSVAISGASSACEWSSVGALLQQSLTKTRKTLSLEQFQRFDQFSEYVSAPGPKMQAQAFPHARNVYWSPPASLPLVQTYHPLGKSKSRAGSISRPRTTSISPAVTSPRLRPPTGSPLLLY